MSIPLFSTNDLDKITPASLVDNLELATKVLMQLRSLEEAYFLLLTAVASTIETHESYISGHNDRIAILSCEIASHIGCTKSEIENIRWAALFHDIGEIIIPSFVLQKTTELNEEEWDVIKDHPRVGAEFTNKLKMLEPAAEIIHAHQERYDGSGYPRGLKGKEIPLGARILSVVDSYDAMTNLRLHRDPGKHEYAIAEIKRLSGTHYDPDIVHLFLSIF